MTALIGDAPLVVDALAEMVDGVFTQVHHIGDQLAECYRAFGDDGVTRRDVAAVQPRLPTSTNIPTVSQCGHANLTRVVTAT